MQALEENEAMRREKLGRLDQIALEMRELIASIETWAEIVNESWPRREEDVPSNIVTSDETDEFVKFPMPPFPFTQILNYNDLWLVKILQHSIAGLELTFWLRLTYGTSTQQVKLSCESPS